MVFFSGFMVGSSAVEDFTAVGSIEVYMKWILRCDTESCHILSGGCCFPVTNSLQGIGDWNGSFLLVLLHIDIKS